MLDSLLDIIYPPKCPLCNEFHGTPEREEPDRGRSICRNCLNQFTEITPDRCAVCGRPFVARGQEEHWCEDCLRKRPYYEAAGAPYLYEEPLMTAIHQFKYGDKSYLADALGPLLARFAQHWIPPTQDLMIMPVPLHPKRLRERGFNQSLLLARHVAKQLHSQLDFLNLRRVKHTPPQTGLKKDERRKNVKQAFMLKDGLAVKGRSLLLVDDVATTGNTLNECARTLKRARSRKVFCITLARAAFP